MTTAVTMPRGTATPVVAELVIRRTWRGAAALAATNVVVTVTAVIGYVAAYPNPADRMTLAASIGSNAGLRALFGETRQLETVAGFTEWRVVLILAVVGAVWALFATTRVLRGEEESGRADVLLAGAVTRTGATVGTLLALGLVIVAVLAVTAAGLLIGSGNDLGGDHVVLLALTLMGTPAVMVGVGAVASQLVDTRRRAVAIGSAVLGAAYLVRVVADSGDDRSWLRWATPLGWLELAHPLTEPRILPVALSYALGVLLCGAAVLLVRIRDTGAGVFAGSGGRRSRTRGLDSALGLALRLSRGTALAWGVGLALFGGLIGLVARTASQAMADSQTSGVLGELGVDGTDTRAYVGVLFAILTVALAAAAAGRVSATREEEASGRLDTVISRPVGRQRWLLGRLAVATGVLVLGASATVAGAWAAGQAGDLGVGVVDLAKAGANCLPAAVFVLGAGTLVYGFLPRAATTVTYSYVAGAFLLEFVGSAVDLPSWLLNLSVLHHVAPVPAVPADTASAAVMLLLGAGLAALGVLGLVRRDVVPA